MAQPLARKLKTKLGAKFEQLSKKAIIFCSKLSAVAGKLITDSQHRPHHRGKRTRPPVGAQQVPS
jgi:hypothetical protein